MFKKTALIAGIALATSTAAQADYRFEVDTALSGGDVESIALGGTAFLQPVDDSEGPFAEAAFIDHATSLSLFALDGEIDADGAMDDFELEAYAVDVRYVTKKTGSWIVDLGYERSEPGNAEIDTFSIGAGKYLTDTTTLVFTYSNSDADVGGDLDSYRLDLDHLFLFGEGGGLKLHGAYGVTDVDDDEEFGDDDDIDVYELDATWYPCRNLGIGAGYRNTDDDGAEFEEYFAAADYFITKDVSVGVAYTEGEFEDSDVETDSWVFTARARF